MLPFPYAVIIVTYNRWLKNTNVVIIFIHFFILYWADKEKTYLKTLLTVWVGEHLPSDEVWFLLFGQTYAAHVQTRSRSVTGWPKMFKISKDLCRSLELWKTLAWCQNEASCCDLLASSRNSNSQSGCHTLIHVYIHAVQTLNKRGYFTFQWYRDTPVQTMYVGYNEKLCVKPTHNHKSELKRTQVQVSVSPEPEWEENLFFKMVALECKVLFPGKRAIPLLIVQ